MLRENRRYHGPLDKAVPDVLERLVGRLPTIPIDTLREQWNGLTNLEANS
jgi:transposase